MNSPPKFPSACERIIRFWRSISAWVEPSTLVANQLCQMRVIRSTSGWLVRTIRSSHQQWSSPHTFTGSSGWPLSLWGAGPIRRWGRPPPRRSCGDCLPIRPRAAIAMTALVLVGCGSSTAVRSDTTGAGSGATTPQAHPQVVEPVAGQGGGRTTTQLAQGGEAAPPLHDPAPNVAASNTSAVAKGAPSDPEVRAAVAKFQAAVRTCHLDHLNLSDALL